MDHGENCILEIRGTKKLYTGDPFDRAVISERAQELFHDRHSRELVKWDEGFRARARVFDLEPGLGGYMPSTAAHMVENGPEPSVTISFTYYTDSTRRRELPYRGNARLRRFGIEPRAVGQSRVRDRIQYALLSSVFNTQSAIRRVMGLGVRDNGVPHAPA